MDAANEKESRCNDVHGDLREMMPKQMFRNALDEFGHYWSLVGDQGSLNGHGIPEAVFKAIMRPEGCRHWIWHVTYQSPSRNAP